MYACAMKCRNILSHRIVYVSINNIKKCSIINLVQHNKRHHRKVQLENFHVNGDIHQYRLPRFMGTLRKKLVSSVSIL